MTNTPPNEGRQAPAVKELLSSSHFAFPDRSGQPQAAPVPVAVLATKPYAEQNPEYHSIDLPSHFQFYDFKTLSCRTLQGVHQAKFHRAFKEQKLRYTVEAISATLEPDRSAFDLTPSDFYFLMYWQRVNSFEKSPMIVQSSCDDPDHNLKVTKKELPEDSLDNETLVTMTTLDQKDLKPLDLEAIKKELSGYDLHVETMRDVVECTERLLDMSLEDGLEEFTFLSARAVFLRASPMMTLDERCKIVGRMTPDETAAMDRYIDLVVDYGVEESANVKCKGCGASKRIHIAFDALSFLPGGR